MKIVQGKNVVCYRHSKNKKFCCKEIVSFLVIEESNDIIFIHVINVGQWRKINVN